MKKFGFILGVFTALIASNVVAGPATDKIAQREPEPFAGYSKKCGFPILFANTNSISLARIDARLGKIIVLDPVLRYPGQDAHRRFLIAHECAHHLQGHTSVKGLQNRRKDKGVEDQELSADCWAAEALALTDYAANVKFIADAFYRKGLHSPGSGYPSGVQRSTMVYHCLQSARRQKAAKENTSSERK